MSDRYLTHVAETVAHPYYTMRCGLEFIAALDERPPRGQVVTCLRCLGSPR